MTTATMLRSEREIIDILQKSNEQPRSMLLNSKNRVDALSRHPEINDSQRRAVEEVSASFEKIVGIDGVAGAGKTTTLAVIRKAAERDGYAVEGFAPTSRAAQKLGEAGIETSTLQMHLARGEKPDTGEKRLYVLDESSLASTKQMHEFLTRLHPNDRVLLVGDKRQFTAPDNEAKIANRELATVGRISEGKFNLRMDDGRSVEIAPLRKPASRLWLCRNQSFKPGTDGRAGAGPHPYRARRKRFAQQPHGVRSRLALSARCADIHE